MLAERMIWMKHSERLKDEIIQCRYEGKDVEELEREVQIVLNLQEGEDKERLADAVYKKLQKSPIRSDFSFKEPETYDAIRKILPREAFDVFVFHAVHNLTHIFVFGHHRDGAGCFGVEVAQVAAVAYHLPTLIEHRGEPHKEIIHIFNLAGHTQAIHQQQDGVKLLMGLVIENIVEHHLPNATLLHGAHAKGRAVDGRHVVTLLLQIKGMRACTTACIEDASAHQSQSLLLECRHLIVTAEEVGHIDKIILGNVGEHFYFAFSCTHLMVEAGATKWVSIFGNHHE